MSSLFILAALAISSLEALEPLEPVSTSSTAIDIRDIRDVEQLDLESLLGTVTAASRQTESLLKAPAAVTVLDRERIRLSGASAIPELLRLVPGVHVMKNAAGSWVVSLRGTAGLQSNNVVLLLDGAPLNNMVDASVNWHAIPVEISDIERIEIVRGPVSTIHGANAYTGVVAIVTGAGDRIKGSGVGGSIAGGYGDSFEGRAHGAVKGNIGEYSRYQASATTHMSRVEPGQSEDSSPELALAAGHVALEHELSPTSIFRAQAAFARDRRVMVDHLAITPQTLASDNAFAAMSMQWTQLSDTVESLAIFGRGQWYAADEQAQDASLFTYGGADAIGGTLGLDLRLALAEQVSLQLGAEAGGTRVDASFLHQDENARFRQTFGVYANLSATFLDCIAFSAGIREDRSAMNRDPNLAIRASATYFSDAYSLRLSAGSAYRNPTIIEVAARLNDPQNGLILLEGNPELAAPRVDSVELAGNLALGTGMTLTPTIFLERLRSLMVADFNPLVRKTFRNDTRQRVIAGAELELEWDAADWLSANLSVTALKGLTGGEADGATVGLDGHHPAIIGALSLRGTILDQRFGYGLDVVLASSRVYNVRAGIPPRLISAELSAVADLSASLEYRLFEELPLWSKVDVTTHLGGADSPFDHSEGHPVSALFSLEWRRD